MSRFRIHIASDHAGYALKEEVKAWLMSQKYEVYDHGAMTIDEDDDFPDFIGPAAAAVSAEPEQTRGIVFGGSGQGEAMLANRFPNVRATVYYGGDEKIIALSREHNNANILSIGARFVSFVQLAPLLEHWLVAPAGQDDRYLRRNRKIEHITRNI